ncbi:hypothetical protein BJV82DRAFT_225553 [Fennellomyces sp. T-0311]|nr:hypothetical protein BJV82DRAFT_225553 [Fennellomyces sp. T-0311]
MYSCELFYEDAYDFQDEKHQLHQPQQQHQQGLLLSDTYPKLQPLLDYTPDLVPNDTPDDDPLTSFDELCMPTSSSPQVSSYLQYLKEPSAAVDYSNVMMPVMPTVDDCWPGIDTTTNSLLLCPSAMLPETANTGDWFCETADAYFGDFCNEHNSSSTDDGIQRDSFTGMTREYVSLSVSL